jgi:hypothetical protein
MESDVSSGLSKLDLYRSLFLSLILPLFVLGIVPRSVAMMPLDGRGRA